MRKFIIGLIMGIVLTSGTSYAYRIGKPQRVTNFDQKGLVVMNENFERLWDISNGRISFNSGSSASTGTGTIKMGSVNNSNSAGFLKIEKTNGTIVYIPYFDDDTP